MTSASPSNAPFLVPPIETHRLPGQQGQVDVIAWSSNAEARRAPSTWRRAPYRGCSRPAPAVPRRCRRFPIPCCWRCRPAAASPCSPWWPSMHGRGSASDSACRPAWRPSSTSWPLASMAPVSCMRRLWPLAGGHRLCGRRKAASATRLSAPPARSDTRLGIRRSWISAAARALWTSRP